MPTQKSQPRHPSAPEYDDYTHENLRINEWDAGMPCTEAEFELRADLEEGVSGMKYIDTSYENYDEDVVNAPRSDFGFEGEATHRHPAPHDVKRHRFPHRNGY